MSRDLKQKIIETAQSGLETVQRGIVTTKQTLQAAVQQQQILGSSFYPTTLDQQECIKSGWIRKQGGVVRSWHRRWFVLKGDYLCYYTSPDDYTLRKQPLGSVFLPGNHIVEVPFNTADVEKFQFEIRSGDNMRVTTTHETFLCSAESDEDRKDWMRAIKQILYANTGGAIFGQSLEQTLRYDSIRDKMCKVPIVVQHCVEYIRQHGLREEGLFRLPGKAALIKLIAEMYDRGERPSLISGEVANLDVHTVASLLKSYLRELPEPLVPYSAYESVMRIVTREIPEIGVDAAIAQLSRYFGMELSPANYNTLQYVCRLLVDVAANADSNRMTALNLATVFVQCFLQPDAGDDPALMLATSASRTFATQVIITHCDRIFNIEYTPDGASVIVEDLLGLDSVCNASVSGLGSTDFSVRPSDDLFGLEFNGQENENRAPVRRSVITRNRISGAPGGATASNGTDKRHGGYYTRDVKSCSGVINNTENPTDVICSLPENLSVEKRPVPPVRQRANSETVKVLSGPAPKPKPRSAKDQSAGTVVAAVDWQAEVARLNMRLQEVEQERDIALARVNTLEAELNQIKLKFITDE